MYCLFNMPLHLCSLYRFWSAALLRLIKQNQSVFRTASESICSTCAPDRAREFMQHEDEDCGLGQAMVSCAYVQIARRLPVPANAGVSSPETWKNFRGTNHALMSFPRIKVPSVYLHVSICVLGLLTSIYGWFVFNDTGYRIEPIWCTAFGVQCRNCDAPNGDNTFTIKWSLTFLRHWKVPKPSQNFSRYTNSLAPSSRRYVSFVFKWT